MSRHHRNDRYYASEHYKESKEYELESKIELFCKKLKDRLLGRANDGK